MLKLQVTLLCTILQLITGVDPQVYIIMATAYYMLFKVKFYEVIDTVYYMFHLATHPTETVFMILSFLYGIYLNSMAQFLHIYWDYSQVVENGKLNLLETSMNQPLLVDDTIPFNRDVSNMRIEFEITNKVEAMKELDPDLTYDDKRIEEMITLAHKIGTTDTFANRDIIKELSCRVRHLLPNAVYDWTELNTRLIVAELQKLFKNKEYIQIRYTDYPSITNSVLLTLSKPTKSWMELMKFKEKLTHYKEFDVLSKKVLKKSD